MTTKDLSHKLHKKVGSVISKTFGNKYMVKTDSACGKSEGKISLYYGEGNKNENRFCDVDIAIIKNNKIRVILEIDEDMAAGHLCGKFLSSALADHCRDFEMDNSVLFVQVVNNAYYKDKNKDPLILYENVKKAIRNIIPVKIHNHKSKITHYELFELNIKDFKPKEMIAKIKTFLDSK